MDASRLLLLALVLSICAVVFQLIGLASPYWITVNVAGEEIDVNSGLWKSCGEDISTGISACFDTNDAIKADWLKTVQAMSIMAFLSLLVAVVMTVLKLFFLKDSKPLIFVAIGTSFAGAVFILISIAVYAYNINKLFSAVEFNYRFAFDFSIIGMLAAIGCGVVMLVGITKG